MKKSFIILLPFVIIVSSLVIILSSKHPVSPTSIQTNPESTSSWQTYKNTQYGFEFQYPNNLTLKECSGIFANKKSLLCLSAPTAYQYAHSNILIRTIPAPSVSKTKLADILINDAVFVGSGFHPESIDKFTVKRIGTKDYYFIVTGRFEGELTASYYLVNKDAIFAFDLFDSPIDWTNPNWKFEDDKLYQQLTQILSTFKFTAPTPTPNPSAWKLYQNTQFGFEYKYPGDWIQDGNNFISPDKTEGFGIAINLPGYGIECYLPTSEKAAEIIVGGIKSTRVDYIGVNNNPCGDNTDHGMFWIISMNGKTRLDMVYSYRISNSQAAQKRFSQILSTFKFTVPPINPTKSTLKTYQGSKYGITFQYQSNFKVDDSASNLIVLVNQISPAESINLTIDDYDKTLSEIRKYSLQEAEQLSFSALVSEKDINVSALPWKLITLRRFYSTGGYYDEEILYMKTSNHSFTWSTNGNQETINTIHQILPTFKVTN